MSRTAQTDNGGTCSCCQLEHQLVRLFLEISRLFHHRKGGFSTALYGTDTCSRNRLVLCDEDESEYGPFENQILTNKTFKDSCLMLCIFHALTQPFKKAVFPLLPRRSPKSPILSEVGKSYGEFYFILSTSVFPGCMLDGHVNSHNSRCMLDGRVNRLCEFAQFTPSISVNSY